MNVSKFLILFILSRFSVFTSTNDVDESKIYGGERVTALAYPYALALFNLQTQKFFCGASALNYVCLWVFTRENPAISPSLKKHYIVSAAHCLVKKTNTTTPFNYFIRHERLMVIGGTNYIRQILKDPIRHPYSHYPQRPNLEPEPKEIQRRVIHETFIHLNYKRVKYPGLSVNDIGVAKLSVPFLKMRLSVRPISVFSHIFWRAINYQYQIYFANKTCFSVGWGNTVLELKDINEPIIPSRYLNEIPMQVYQSEQCLTVMCKQDYGSRCTRDLLKSFILRRINRVNTEICAYTVGRKRGGPCTGDSGSPLACSWVPVTEPGDHRGDVVGHVSTSRLCGTTKGGPTFYTEYVHYFGFFNIFDMTYIGAMYNPWARPDPTCILEWPDLRHCRRRRRSGSPPTALRWTGPFPLFFIGFFCRDLLIQ